MEESQNIQQEGQETVSESCDLSSNPYYPSKKLESEESKVELKDLLEDHYRKIREIQNGEAIHVYAKQGDIQIFSFEITKPTVIIIKQNNYIQPQYQLIRAWPGNDDSDPDLYLSNETPFVNQATYQWKSANIGGDRIDIHPSDPKYKLGKYYIGMMPYRVGMNDMFVKLTLLEAKPVTMVENDQQTQAVLKDSLFFQYQVQNIGNSFVYVQISQKQNIELYVSTLHLYPSDCEHKWAFGDLPQKVIEQTKQNPYMRDIFTEASPFQVHGQNIHFCRKFANPEQFRPQILAKETEDKALHKLTQYKALESDDQENPNEICVLLETEAWRFISQKAYFGIYNSDKENLEREITFKVTEIKEEELLSEDLKKKFLVYDGVFQDIDAQSISQKERMKNNVCDKTEFTYGEVLFPYFIPLMELCEPKEGEIFWDLGCGGGRPLIISSLAFPQLKMVYGVELLEGLYEVARDTAQVYTNTAMEILGESEFAPVSVIQKDMLVADWSDADIIYTSSICFPDELVEGIANKCEQLKAGSRIISLKSFPVKDYLSLEYTLKIKMTWGRCQVLVYKKKMDIERLNKIKEIFFNKNAKKKKSMHYSRSPVPQDRGRKGNENQWETGINQCYKYTRLTYKDQLKQYEHNMLTSFESKHKSIKRNLEEFTKQKQRRTILMDKTQQQDMIGQSFSPVRGARSTSPFFLNSATKKLTQLFNQRSLTQDRNFEMKCCETSEFIRGDTHDVIETRSKGDHIKQLLLGLLKEATTPEDNSLISNNKMDQINQRLMDAFEKLEMIHQDDIKKHQLVSILDSCFVDLSISIQKGITKCKMTDDDEKSNTMLQKFILHLVELLTKSELEEAIPEIAASIQSMKIKLASLYLQRIMENQKRSKVTKGLKAFQRHSVNMSILSQSIRNISFMQTQKHVSKQMIRAFTQWKHQIQLNGMRQENMLEMSKISQENENLKRFMEVQQAIENCMTSIKEENSLKCFDEVESKLHSCLLEVIPNTQYLKLFLSKDDYGEVLYTYLRTSTQPSSLLQTSKFQSTTLYQQRSKSQTRLRVKYQQQDKIKRSSSQVAGIIHVQNRIPSNMDDISSISGHEGVHIQAHNALEKASQQTNTFSLENTNPHMKRQKSLTRQPSAGVFNQSSSFALLKQYQNKLGQLLNRNASGQSDINFINLKQRSPGISEEQEREILEQIHSFRDERVNDGQQQEAEYEVQSMNNCAKKIEIKTFGSSSLIGQCVQKKEAMIKKNQKNDRQFNEEIDAIIIKDQNEEDDIENAMYVPIISKQMVLGVIQVANCEKHKYYSEVDLEILKLISQKLSLLICDSRENFNTKVLFKKQLEVSLMHTTMENQTVNQLLSLANQLFQSNLPPLKATGMFLRRTERYFKKVFSCQMAQIIIVDQQTQTLYSIDKKQSSSLVQRGSLHEQSLVQFVLQHNDIFVHPIVSSDYILIETECTNTHQQNNMILQQFFNPSIDLPPSSKKIRSGALPKTYLSMSIKDSTNHPLAVIQLIVKENNFRFSDQDVNHLQLLTDHLSQVFTYILQSDFMGQITSHHTQAIYKLTDVLQQRYIGYAKSLFRELLQYKYGKINLIKNKIIRKHLDKHFQVDQQFISKIQKLMTLKQRFVKEHQHKALHKIKTNIKQINEQRKRNALKCVGIMHKYEKILSIRVKDTVFRQWNQIQGASQINVNDDSQMNNTFNFNNYNNANNCSQISRSILEESSITSLIFQRSKGVYRMRKLFNTHKLQRYFDCLVMRTLQGKHKMIDDVRIKRLLILKKLCEKIRYRLCSQYFAKYQNKIKQYKKMKSKLKKLMCKRQYKTLTFGVQKWHQQSENSLKKDLQSEKSFNSSISEQCKEGQLMTMIVMSVNQLTSQISQYRSVQDFTISQGFKNLINGIQDFLVHQSLSVDQSVMTFKIPNLNYAAYTYTCDKGQLQAPLLNTNNEGHFKSDSDSSSLYDHSVSLGNRDTSIMKHFNSFMVQQNQDHYSIQNIDNNDLLIKSLIQTKSAIYAQNLSQDHNLNLSLLRRKLISPQQGLMMPIFDKGTNELIGTIELYSQKDKISPSEQQKYKTFANVIGIGLELLQRQLVICEEVKVRQQNHSSVSTSPVKSNQMMIEAQMQAEQQVKAEVDKVANFKSLGQVIEAINHYVKKTMQASHCQILFVQPSTAVQIYRNNKLEDVDIEKHSFMQDLITQNNANRDITFPSSLLCQSSGAIDDLSFQFSLVNEQFQTVSGNSFEAVKYIALGKSEYSASELFAFVEIGWNQISDAKNIHENDNYLLKKVGQVRERFFEYVNRFKKNIKLLIFALESKSQHINVSRKYVEFFWKWRQLATQPETFSALFSPEINKHRAVTGISHSLQVTRQKNLLTDKVEVEYSPLGNMYMPHRLSVEPYRMSFKGQSIQEVNEEAQLDLEVEKVAKKKLVSASLMIIAVTSNILKKNQMKQAYSEWKSFVTHTQVAETAFNKILEINHKHSTVRYMSAARILTRVFKNKSLKETVHKLKSTTKFQPYGNPQNMFSLGYSNQQQQQKQYYGLSDTKSQQFNQSKPIFSLEFSKVGGTGLISNELNCGNDSQSFVDEIFTMKEIDQQNNIDDHHHRKNQEEEEGNEYQEYDDNESDFSLGTGTQNMIQFKANSILDQARNQFNQNSHRRQ